MKRILISALSLSLLAFGVSAQMVLDGNLVGYLVAASSSHAFSDYWTEGGVVQITLDDDDQDAFVRFSRDYLSDSDFEENPRTAHEPYGNVVSPASHDQWDDNGALDDAWGQTEGAGGGIEFTTTQLFGEESLLFDASAPNGGTAVAQMGANMDITTDLTSWTVSSPGSGTTAVSSTTPHTSGGEKILMTGGDQHEDITQAITTVALTEYFVTWWWQEGASDDLCDLRIQESTGGSQWLLTSSVAGVWQAGEADVVTTDGDSSAAYEQGFIQFTTQASITAITIHFAADVTGDLCSIDDVSMALVPVTEIRTITLFPVLDTGADSYAIVANHQDGGTDSRLQVQLLDAETCTGDSACLYWDGTSDWVTTETWVTLANVGTTTTQGIETFLAHDAALTVDHRLQVRFRALMGTAEDITLDNVFLVETATVDADIAMFAEDSIGVLGEILVTVPADVRGRFTVIGTGAIGVHFLGAFYGGS